MNKRSISITLCLALLCFFSLRVVIAKSSDLAFGQVHKVVWKEGFFSPRYQMRMSELKFDHDFIKSAPKNIIALLALYGYKYGNECEWDGQASEKRDNLRCALNTALKVGYQCSKAQLKLLHQYFPHEQISEARCPTIPTGSTIQSALRQISITQIDQETFQVNVKYATSNVREDSFHEFDEIEKFRFMKGHFSIIK